MGTDARIVRLCCAHASNRVLAAGYFIPKTGIACFPFGHHSSEDRLSLINVVEDDHLALRWVQTVEPARILGQRAAPRDGHCQEQGIKARVVEALTEISASGQQYAFLPIWHCGHSLYDLPALIGLHPATEDDDVLCKAGQAPRQQGEMILSLSEHHRRPTSLKHREHVVEDHRIAALVARQCAIEILDRNALRAVMVDGVKACPSVDDLVKKWSNGGLFPGVNMVSDGAALHENDRVMTILSCHRRRQPEHKSRPCRSRDCFEADSR
jgi:hypothetical protein